MSDTPQGPLLNGYRKLTDEEVALSNEVKRVASYVELLVNKLVERGGALDQRWVAEGRTDLQKGFMSLVRSVTKPTSF
jgi:hypothetical protein